MSTWRPGTVIKGNARGMVLVEFEFAGASNKGLFDEMKSGLVFETGAMSPPRSWKDSEGKILYSAVVASINGDDVPQVEYERNHRGDFLAQRRRSEVSEGVERED